MTLRGGALHEGADDLSFQLLVWDQQRKVGWVGGLILNSHSKAVIHLIKGLAIDVEHLVTSQVGLGGVGPVWGVVRASSLW